MRTRKWSLAIAGLGALIMLSQARAETPSGVVTTKRTAKGQPAETDTITEYRLADGRKFKRTVTEHEWIRKGKACGVSWKYETPTGAKKTWSTDYVFKPGTRYKSTSWTANGTQFYASSTLSPKGEVVAWDRRARHGARTIRTVGRWADGVRFNNTDVPTPAGLFSYTRTMVHPDGRTATQKYWLAKNTIFVQETVRRPDGTVASAQRHGQHRSKTITMNSPFAAQP